MERIELIAPCHFGLEAVLKREITDLGYEIAGVEDGRVSFYGDRSAVCRSNIFLRTAERILWKVGRFHAETFDQLFEETFRLNWGDYIPRDGKFWVAKAASVGSQLFSPSDIQSIMKKAMVKKLGARYGIEWFPEDGPKYPIRVFLKKDEVTVAIDTSGESLHKRGYRTVSGEAPISETLAAALIKLTPWKGSRPFIDPFCGSGTFPIEAAMMAKGIAPGAHRTFTAQTWDNLLSASAWQAAFTEAKALEHPCPDADIAGFDIDGEVLSLARRNARAAGVGDIAHFGQQDVADLSHDGHYGFIVTNPPYGERMEETDLPALYRAFGESFRRLPDWSAYMITAYPDAERYFGRKAAKNRKIYNGMIKTYFYQFPGPKPVRRKESAHETDSVCHQ